MNKIEIWVVGILVVVALGTFGAYVAFCPSQNIIKRNAIVAPLPSIAEPQGMVNCAKNAEYNINGETVILSNGVSEINSTPGSSSKIITRYFGNEVWGRINNDEAGDVAYILTQETGGSGVFYYVAVALASVKGCVVSDVIFLGDRIAPQSTELKNGNTIVINYADRKAGEPFTTQPSLGKSIWLLLDTQTMKLGEVAQNFEGEASVTTMKLNMKTWNWVNTVYADGKTVTPRDPARFGLTFNEESFSAGTDCNRISGQYSVEGSNIGFSNMISTKMACQESQEGDIISGLSLATSYHFTTKGELVLNFAENTGMMTYK